VTPEFWILFDPLSAPPTLTLKTWNSFAKAEYGPIGRDGRWTDFGAVAAFLRAKPWRPTTNRKIAVHEACHAVVAHSLGVPTARITTTSGDRPPHHQIDEALAAMLSCEERMRTSLAGRAADEEQGDFMPLTFRAGSDEAHALISAAIMANDDPIRAAELVVNGLIEVRNLVRKRWSDVLRVADAVQQGDVTGSHLITLLGPLPPAQWTRDQPHRVAKEISDAMVCSVADALLSTKMRYGVAALELEHRDEVRWLDIDAVVQATRVGTR
jgi:hypothetical protein